MMTLFKKIERYQKYHIYVSSVLPHATSLCKLHFWAQGCGKTNE